MKKINTRSFREKLSEHLNGLMETNEPLLVTAPDRRVVIISEAQYLMMIEQINEGKHDG